MKDPQYLPTYRIDTSPSDSEKENLRPTEVLPWVSKVPVVGNEKPFVTVTLTDDGSLAPVDRLEFPVLENVDEVTVSIMTSPDGPEKIVTPEETLPTTSGLIVKLKSQPEALTVVIRFSPTDSSKPIKVQLDVFACLKPIESTTSKLSTTSMRVSTETTTRYYSSTVSVQQPSESSTSSTTRFYSTTITPCIVHNVMRNGFIPITNIQVTAGSSFDLLTDSPADWVGPASAIAPTIDIHFGATPVYVSHVSVFHAQNVDHLQLNSVIQLQVLGNRNGSSFLKFYINDLHLQVYPLSTSEPVSFKLAIFACLTATTTLMPPTSASTPAEYCIVPVGTFGTSSPADELVGYIDVDNQTGFNISAGDRPVRLGDQVPNDLIVKSILKCEQCQCEGTSLACSEYTPCPCSWSEWTDYGECTKPCGGGQQEKTRSGYGIGCELKTETKVRDCNIDNCTIECTWGQWGNWSSCSRTCDGGEKVRTRLYTPPQVECDGLSKQTSPCNLFSCKENCTDGLEYKDCDSYCPYTCRHFRGIEGCVTDGCQPGCHCPNGQYRDDNGDCVPVCPCYFNNATLEIGEKLPSPTSKCDICECTEDGIRCSLIEGGCSVNCTYTEWSEYGVCSKTCGEGTANRYRKVLQEAEGDGVECTGPFVEQTTCSEQPCIETCLYNGVSYSDHDVVVDEKCHTCVCLSGEVVCNNKTEAHKDGNWSPWSDYGECSASCGDSGEMFRHRSCSWPTPSCDGKECVGNISESEPCNRDIKCPENGNWCDWQPGKCSKTCGGGTYARERICNCPPPSGGGKTCPGEDEEVLSCNEKPCPVDCEVSEWESWGPCSVTCGSGQQETTRTITQFPLFGGKECPDDLEKRRQCELEDCVDHQCNETVGLRYYCKDTCPQTCEHVRDNNTCIPETNCTLGCHCEEGKVLNEEGLCVTPAECGCAVTIVHPPFGETKQVLGAGDEIIAACYTCKCPVNSTDNQAICTHDPNCIDVGHWSAWGEWSECPACYNGERPITVKYAQCVCSWIKGQPIIELSCSCVEGDYIATRTREELCPIEHCPVDCEHSLWSQWTDCSVTCGSGTEVRRRSVETEATYGGYDCSGPVLESRPCSRDSCNETVCEKENMVFADCAKPCPRTCAEISYDVTCEEPNPEECVPDCVCANDTYIQDGECVEKSECKCTVSVTTSNGTQEVILQEPGDVWQEKCNLCTCEKGKAHCGNNVCEHWSPWEPYSDCNVTCGEGIRISTRECLYNDTTDNYEGCPGLRERVEACKLDPCEVECDWTPWGDWSDCSKTCGTGEKTQSRQTIPVVGSDVCDDVTENSTMTCNTQPCKEVCEDGKVEDSCANECNTTCKERSLDSCQSSGLCEAGCKCKEDELLEDGKCVPISECHCYWDPNRFIGIPQLTDEQGNLKERFENGEIFRHECNVCTCVEGLFECTEEECDKDCEISEYVPGNCSVTCGFGTVIEKAEIKVQPEYNGRPCPPLEREGGECYAGDCECGENEVYTNTTECEHRCEHLNGELIKTEVCIMKTNECYCKPNTYRNASGICVSAEECGCVTLEGIKKVGEQWPSLTKECETCECRLGDSEPFCSADCKEIPEVDEMHTLEYLPGECCPIVVPRNESTCQLKRRMELLSDGKGCVSQSAVELTWCAGHCGESKDVPELVASQGEVYSINTCKCCTGEPETKEVVADCGDTSRTMYYSQFKSCTCNTCA